MFFILHGKTQHGLDTFSCGKVRLRFVHLFEPVTQPPEGGSMSTIADEDPDSRLSQTGIKAVPEEVRVTPILVACSRRRTGRHPSGGECLFETRVVCREP